MSMHLQELEFVSHLFMFTFLPSRLVHCHQADILWYSFQVHDFGFFCYDPSAVQFLTYQEIPLAPEAASVGLEIRVVGNDSGEKVRYIGWRITSYFRLYFSVSCYKSSHLLNLALNLNFDEVRTVYLLFKLFCQMSNLGCKKKCILIYVWCIKTHLWISNASGNWSVDLQVSILAGTLARLDRDAPHYKKYLCFTAHVF